MPKMYVVIGADYEEWYLDRAFVTAEAAETHRAALETADDEKRKRGHRHNLRPDYAYTVQEVECDG